MSFSPEELRTLIEKEFTNPKSNPIIEPPETVATESLAPLIPDLPDPPLAFGKIIPDETNETDEEDDENDDSNITYRYLYDDPLAKEFGFNRDFNKLYNISLCLYKINDDLDTPFIDFLFIKKDGKYSFPQTELNMEPFISINNSAEHITPNSYLETGSETNGNVVPDENVSVGELPTATSGEEFHHDNNLIDDEFFNQCSLFFTKLFGKIDDSTLKSVYRGFIDQITGNTGTVYVVFDCTDLDLEDVTRTGNSEANSSVLPPIEFTWGIIDEITVKHRIVDTPIEESNYKLFEENQILKYVKRMDGINVDIPISVFLCSQINDTYKNVYYNDNVNEKYMFTRSLINPVVYHDILDEIYMFSTEPLENANLNRIKRFALFTKGFYSFNNKDKPLDEFVNNNNAQIDQPPSTMSTENATNVPLENSEYNFTDTATYNDFTGFSFFDGERLMWCAKTMDLFVEL